MTRAVCWYLVGSLVLVALAGCARGWFGEREPWRREAEAQCLRSGAVKESPAVAILRPIRGPGMCGADYPLKVAALGESAIIGYADEPIRPPVEVPQSSGSRRPSIVTPAPLPPYSPVPSYPAGAAYPANAPDGASAPSPRFGPPPADLGEPLSLTPPGVEPAPADMLGSYATPMPTYAPPKSYSRESYPPYPPPYPANGETVPLGPSRGPQITASGGPTAVTPPATLACPVVSALDRWMSEAVQPAARRWFGQPVAQIKQISAYSCRGMNGNPNAHISEHAFGNALDIAAFVLADGHAIAVKSGWRGSAEEQGFLRDVQGAACEYFTTVLAPGSNAYHYDHIHVDLMRRARGRHICEPAAVAGEVAAARARERTGYAARRPRDPAITGTILPPRTPAPIARLPDAQFGEDLDLPEAIAGED